MGGAVCECGHKNPAGTEFCEACGKPLQGDDKQKNELLNMRYEGSARRSQIYKRTLVDKIWNFFSSVKIGIFLIILVLIAISIGTIFPQDIYIPPSADPKTFYKEQYGFLGTAYKTLGFDHLYGSWWFIILLGLLGLSIIVASVDRYFPLRRALKKQLVTRHDRFMKKQRIFGVTTVQDGSTLVDKIKQLLESRRYRVKEENGNLLAEKSRFARWGPYVNHIGLIIVLTAGMLRFFPGMYVNEVLWLREGQSAKVPGTHGEFYLTNHKFILQTYDKKNSRFQDSLSTVQGNVAKNYQSNVTLFKAKEPYVLGDKPQLKKVDDAQIKVNHPLKFNHFEVFQADYRLNEFSKMNFKLENKKTHKTYGPFQVDLNDPKKTYHLADKVDVSLMSYFPDFYFNDKGQPDSKTDTPNNPAFIFKMFTPGHPKGELSFIAIKTNLEPMGKNDYKIDFDGIETNNVSGFVVKKDLTLWIAFIGAIIFLIGVGQGMYFNHRRIWVKRKGHELWISAHTNKNWFGIKRDISLLTENLPIDEPADQLEEKVLLKEKEKRA